MKLLGSFFFRQEPLFCWEAGGQRRLVIDSETHTQNIIGLLIEDISQTRQQYCPVDITICQTPKDTPITLLNKLIQPNHAYSCLGFRKLCNVLLSRIGRKAS